MRTLAQVRRKMKIASVAPGTRNLYVNRPARVVRTRQENLRLARRDTAPKPATLRVRSRRVGFRRRGSDAAGDATPPEGAAAGLPHLSQQSLRASTIPACPVSPINPTNPIGPVPARTPLPNPPAHQPHPPLLLQQDQGEAARHPAQGARAANPRARNRSCSRG